ncbi:hypothetical protein V6N13_052050 [Hibiscus sabdariffa]
MSSTIDIATHIHEKPCTVPCSIMQSTTSLGKVVNNRPPHKYATYQALRLQRPLQWIKTCQNRPPPHSQTPLIPSVKPLISK